MNFIKLAIKNLLRRKMRTILTVAGVAIAVAALFSLSSFKDGYEKQLTKELDNMGIHILAVPKGCPYEAASLIIHGGVIPKYLSTTDFEQVKGMQGIDLATPMLLQQFYTNETPHVVYGINAADMQQLKPWWKVDGRFFADAEDNVMVIGKNIAEKKNLQVGSTMPFGPDKETFTVIGILDRTGGQDDEFHFLPLASAQRMFNKAGYITTIAVRVKDITKISQVGQTLETIPDIQVVTMSQIMGTILNLVGSTQTLLISVIIIAVIICVVGIINTLLMSVNERIREFGMMKALGASGFDIGRLVLIETILITVSGGIIGAAVSIGASSIIEGFVRNIIPYAPAGQIISPDMQLVLLCLAFSVVIGIICGIYPALRSARLTPIGAIRSSYE